MKLIVGGAYQGKLGFAVRLAKSTDVADGCSDSLEAALERKIINHLHEYIRRFCTLEEGDAEAETKRFIETMIEKNGKAVIVCNELGCGIVPAVSSDRMWRELTGTACQRLAEQADEGFRVVGGLPQRLKGGTG